jgi:hypothetical protein
MRQQYSADGSLDPTFGNDGTVAVKTAIAIPDALALLSNDDIALHSSVTSTTNGASIVTDRL